MISVNLVESIETQVFFLLMANHQVKKNLFCANFSCKKTIKKLHNHHIKRKQFTFDYGRYQNIYLEIRWVFYQQ